MMISEGTKKEEREPVPEGLHLAVCAGVIDLGTQYSQKFNHSRQQVLLWFEFADFDIEIDGEDLPRVISRTFTASLHAKAALRPFLETWRGQKFTATELQGFELKNLLEAGCQVQVMHSKSQNTGRVYADLHACMPLAAKQKQPKIRGNKLWFDYSEQAQGETPAIPDEVPAWIKDKITQADEFTRCLQGPADLELKGEDEEEEEGKVPF